MVNFERACVWLRQGKKITRPVWEDHSYWKLGVDEIIEYADGNRAVVHLNQFNATDWKIWKEKEDTLKTLKDLKYENADGNIFPVFSVDIDRLRQEAIKWINAFTNQMDFGVGHRDCRADWIKHFFNITNKELR